MKIIKKSLFQKNSFFLKLLEKSNLDYQSFIIYFNQLKEKNKLN